MRVGISNILYILSLRIFYKPFHNGKYKQLEKRSSAGARVPRVPFYLIPEILYIHFMSRKYKFLNKEGLYFVSFATVNWIDLFIRVEYCSIIVDSLD